MKSVIIIIVGLVATASALPGKTGGGNPCGLVGACPTVGAMQCCGTGFVTCDFSGWVFRQCGPGTTCYQLPAPGPLFCGYPVGQPAP